MELKDIARKLPEEIWEVFEPLLPKVVWVGNGQILRLMQFGSNGADLGSRHRQASQRSFWG